MDPPSRQGNDPYGNNFVDPNDDNFEDASEEMSFPDFCGNLGDVMGSTEGRQATSNYASTEIAGNTSSTQNYGVPLYGMPLNQQQPMATPPPMQMQQRERTYTDESTDTTGTVDKKTLVKLMREQVDLVRRLTNAQIAQKAELERVKEEKRKLEEAQQQQQQQAKQAAKLAQKEEMKEVMKQAQQQQLRASQTNVIMAPINEEPAKQSAARVAGQSAAKVMYPAEKYTMPLPPARLRVDTSDSDSKSVASSIFKRPPDNRYIPLNVPKSQQKVRRHPDAMYFRAGYDESTIANGDPSMASTIKFPPQSSLTTINGIGPEHSSNKGLKLNLLVLEQLRGIRRIGSKSLIFPNVTSSGDKKGVARTLVGGHSHDYALYLFLTLLSFGLDGMLW
jgi:hypothetical protein